MNQLDDQPRNEFGRMRFFTPELLMRLNSKDGEVVDRAMQTWEEAIVAYNQSLPHVLSELPPQSRAIATLSLHDWKLVMIKSPSGATPGLRHHSMFLALEFRNDLAVISYALTDKLRRIDSPEDWSLAGNKSVYWLYDELDLNGVSPGTFVHSILFSDGTTLVIPFSALEVAQIKPEHSVSHSDLMQIA